MGKLVSRQATYEFSPLEIGKLIAEDLNVAADEKIDVSFVIGDVGPGDPMDRFPAPQGVVAIRATVSKK